MSWWRCALVLVSFAMTIPAAAQPGSLRAGDLCAAVEAQTEEIEPRYELNFYQYQTLLAAAAGVQRSDSEATVNAKIGGWLNANMSWLLCERFNFSPHRGNILRLAVSRQSEPFIDDVLRTWRVGLNQIDVVDGKTVLDHIADLRTESGSNQNLVRIWTRYYDRFRAAGARHASELR